MRTFAKLTSPPRTLVAGATLALGIGIGALGYAGVTGEPLLSSAHAQQPRQAAQTKQHVVITMSHGTDDLHASIMALKLAEALLDEGANVTLFVNLEAVRLVDTRQPDDLRWGAGSETVGKLFRSVVADGGKILVCPHCAKAVGLTSNTLRRGASVATLEQVAEAMLMADKVIDY